MVVRWSTLWIFLSNVETPMIPSSLLPFLAAAEKAGVLIDTRQEAVAKNCDCLYFLRLFRKDYRTGHLAEIPLCFSKWIGLVISPPHTTIWVGMDTGRLHAQALL